MHTIMISVVGAPGSGKSTFSLGLAHSLKRAGIQAEFVPEVIKHEVFTPEGVARVRSGKYDLRYLRAQHALTRGFVENTEVIINDGALEPFLYYARPRIAADQFKRFEDTLRRFRQEQAKAQQRFYTLELGLAYEAQGRCEAESEAKAMQQDLLESLRRDFGVEPVVLRSQEAIDSLAQEIIGEVQRLRRRPSAHFRKSRT